MQNKLTNEGEMAGAKDRLRVRNNKGLTAVTGLLSR